MWGLRALYLVAGLAGAALVPYFAILLSGRGLNPAEVGLVLAAASLASAIATPLWGHVADTRLGGGAVLRVSSLAAALAAVATALTGYTSVAALTMAALMYACAAPSVPLADSLALSWLGPTRMGDFGRIRLWSSAGWSVAAIILGALYQRHGLQLVLPCYAVGVIAFGLLTMTLPQGSRPVLAESRLGAIGDAFRSSPRLAPLLVGLFIVGVATSSAWAFVGVRIVGQGGGPFLVGLASALSAIVEVPVMFFTPSLGRRFGMPSMYVAGILVYGAVCLMWALTPDPLATAVVAGVRGIAFAFTYIGCVVIVGQMVPRRVQSTGQALAQTSAWILAPMVGALLGGILYMHLGASTMFAGCAAMCAAGAAMVGWVLAGAHPQ